MGNVHIELNSEGVRALLRSAEIMSVCREYADAARSRLGEGYEVTTHMGQNRVNASVAAVTAKARKENLEQNSILKALR